MKKLLTLLCFLTTMFGARAGEPTDYVYATGLQYDSEYDLYYFDVILEGENLYTGYGLDIQLPAGMEVVDDEYGIFVEMIKEIYPTSGRNKEYTHSVTPAFPNSDDHSHLRVGCMSNQNLDMLNTSGPLFRVYVNINYTPNPWPIGAIKLYAVELNKVGAPYDAPVKETIVPIHTGETTLPLTINRTNQWSTCILPFAAAIPAGVKAYTVGGHDSENLLLSEANSFAAYTPYILYSEGGYSGNVSGTVDPNQYPATGVENKDSYLNGAIVAQNVTSGYVIQNLSEGVKFYQITEGTFNVPAGKCWMTLSAGGPVKGLGFVVEDESAIEQIKTPESHIIYNLAGQQVQNPQKGIYIVNGKKVMY